MDMDVRGGSLPQQWSSGNTRVQSTSHQSSSLTYGSQVCSWQRCLQRTSLSDVKALDTDNHAYHVCGQASRVHGLQSKLAEVQQQLNHETRRAQLLEQELTHLRSLTLQHTGQKSASVNGVTKHYALGAIYPSGSELTPPDSGQGKAAKQAAEKDIAPLDAVPRPRPKSVDGYIETSSNVSEQMQRRGSAPAGEVMQAPPEKIDKTVSTALHAVSGAYLKEQAAISTMAQKQRREIPSSATSDSERLALRFVEEAQPVPLSQGTNTVTISRPAFELLVLKDRAINSVKEGITIAECSLPDHPLIFANDAFTQITGYSREEVLGKNCRQVLVTCAAGSVVVSC